MPESNARDFSTLRYFTIKVYEALIHLGHNCRLLEGEQRFDLTLEKPPDFTVSFNYTLQDTNGFFWCDSIQVPHMMIMVDPPYYFKNLRHSRNLITTCDGKCFIEILRTPSNPNVFFLPTGVEIDLKPPTEVERPYEVVYFTGYIDYEARPKLWKEKFPRDVYNAMMGAIEISTENEDILFINAFETTFNECLKQSRDINIFEVNILDILHELDLYLKGLQRVKVLQAIDDADVHIFKNTPQDLSWGKYVMDKPNITFHDAVTFEQSIEIMQKSKILLSTSIKKQGTQDRVFYGLACGALSLTNENIYLDEHFKDGINIAFFKYHELDQINEIINYYLEDEFKRKSIAKQGRGIVMEHHTWDHRMMTILPHIALIIERMRE